MLEFTEIDYQPFGEETVVACVNVCGRVLLSCLLMNCFCGKL